MFKCDRGRRNNIAAPERRPGCIRVAVICKNNRIRRIAIGTGDEGFMPFSAALKENLIAGGIFAGVHLRHGSPGGGFGLAVVFVIAPWADEIVGRCDGGGTATDAHDEEQILDSSHVLSSQ